MKKTLKRKSASLSQSASLTALSRLILQGCSLLLNFFVTPAIILGLGKAMFGVWSMLSQTIGFLALTDLRPMGTLKFTLAVRRYSLDESDKSRQLGAAIFSSLAMTPLLLVGGALLVIYSGDFFGETDVTDQLSIRTAMLIMVINLVISRILSFPGCVITGENIEYKGFLPHLIGIIAGSLLSLLAVKIGWGLIGMAAAALISQVVVNGGTLLVVMRHVKWLKFVVPDWQEFKTFLVLSFWLFCTVLLSTALTGSGALVTGIFLNAEMAAVFTVSSAALRMLYAPMQAVIGAGNTGIIGLCGKQDWGKLDAVRFELHVLLMAIFSVVGGGFLLLNDSFVRLWVKGDYCAGPWFTLAMLLVFYLRMAEQIESIFVDGALIFAQKSHVLLGSVLVTGILMWPLAKEFGLTGIAAAYAGGMLVLLVCYMLLIKKYLHQDNLHLIRTLTRPFLVMVGVWGCGFAGSWSLGKIGWLGFLGVGAATSGVIGVIFLFAGLNQVVRRRILTRFSNGLPESLRNRLKLKLESK